MECDPGPLNGVVLLLERLSYHLVRAGRKVGDDLRLARLSRKENQRAHAAAGGLLEEEYE
jgi:hypothetical protein